jgi:hypothetical protein
LRDALGLIGIQEVCFVEDQQAGFLDLLVENVHHIVAERHGFTVQTPLEESKVGEDRQRGALGGYTLQFDQGFHDGGDQVRARAHGFGKDDVRHGRAFQLVQAGLQIVIVAAEAAAGHFHRRNARAGDERGVDQVASLIVRHHAYPGASRHQVFHGSDDRRGLPAAQKTADKV